MSVEDFEISISRYRYNDEDGLLNGPAVSILIASLRDRDDKLKELIDNLICQWNALNVDDSVSCPIGIEIIAAIDSGEMAIGLKRNLLMGIATGRYMCYVDDDDRVSDDYLRLALCALSEKPDCLGIVGLLHERNTTTEFIHSLRYDAYGQENGRYVRPPKPFEPNSQRCSFALSVQAGELLRRYRLRNAHDQGGRFEDGGYD